MCFVFKIQLTTLMSRSGFHRKICFNYSVVVQGLEYKMVTEFSFQCASSEWDKYAEPRPKSWKADDPQTKSLDHEDRNVWKDQKAHHLKCISLRSGQKKSWIDVFVRQRVIGEMKGASHWTGAARWRHNIHTWRSIKLESQNPSYQSVKLFSRCKGCTSVIQFNTKESGTAAVVPH